MVVDDKWLPVDVFSGTVFIANGELPAGPASGPVSQQTPWVMELAEARHLADLFGFSGPLYRSPVYEPAPGEVAPDLPPSYFGFEGQRLFQADSWMTYYQNASLYLPENPASPEEARALVVQFLTERGLLDYAYEVRDGFAPGAQRRHRLAEHLQPLAHGAAG
jgi:hypothetical protein